MSVGLSHGNNWEELAALVDRLDRLYDTPLTNGLVEAVQEVVNELRERHKCQYCGEVTTRWMCDKPHADMPRY
jgi:hypothetical protein